jgi:hypothetical protein
MPKEQYQMVRCREMRDSDVEQVIDLLTQAFDRKRNYWSAALQRLKNHMTPSGLPKYGYVIDDDGTIVGAILLIFTAFDVNGKSEIRCNVSSWCVKPAYGSYATLLSMRAIRHPNVTFFNVSPAPHTWTILERQGFSRFATGRTIAAPALSRPMRGVRVRAADRSIRSAPDLDQKEIDVLSHHVDYGCIALTCEFDSVRYPFVFGTHLRYGFLPVAHLVYCRNLEDFVRFAGPIGRFLLRRGYACVIFDSNGPIRGIFGRHFGNRPRYRKGCGHVSLGDVAYSEQVMFGY